MTKKEFEEIITKLLKEDIEITLFYDKDCDIVKYNLNTEMKSNLYLSFDEVSQKCFCEGRYEYINEEIYSYDHVLSQVKLCMCGKSYANLSWIDLLIKEGYLEEIITTTTTYK